MCRLAWRWIGACGMRRNRAGEGGWWTRDGGREWPDLFAREVEAEDLGAPRRDEVTGDVGELGECPCDRAQRDPFERGAERRDGVVEALPQLRVTATVAVAAQLIGEVHVARARSRAPPEAKRVSEPERRGLLLARVCDRAHSGCESRIGWRGRALVESRLPAAVRDLQLLDRQSRVVGHKPSFVLCAVVSMTHSPGRLIGGA